ncbi:hypothetical protein [Shimia abyssi]|uniref:PH (Pleckstrin Homology) domain-containing protein n=1 Tax=Shimia abyssi TaxID=1662395 RepID=A0A2P8FH14_9RHOB|nr:hypothetical protein [Shimia abyssi]PSL20989.1 hypothetical protein CLV88_102108 [Shimia abyssi]
MTRSMTPDSPLGDGETILTSFRADRATYIQANTWLAAGAMAGGMLILWLVGNPHVWTGAIGGFAAVAVRAFYMMSEELSVRWDLTNQRLLGPMGRAIPLSAIKNFNTLGNMVQLVTHSGDKHLIKYQHDPAHIIATLKHVAAGGTP